MIQSVWRS